MWCLVIVSSLSLTFHFSHFNNNSNYDAKVLARDWLFKISPVLDHFTCKFKSVYTPDKHVIIDEELLFWKGKLGFKQCISNKRAWFGIKMLLSYVISRVTSGTPSYISGKMQQKHLKIKPWSKNLEKVTAQKMKFSIKYFFSKCNQICRKLQIWSRLLKKSLMENFIFCAVSGVAVSRLMSDLYSNEYHVYVDNSYTSERLFKHLAENGTVAFDITMGNCIKTPPSLKTELLQKGEYTFWRNGNTLMVRYKDKKKICFLSKIHEIKVERLRKRGHDGLSPSEHSLVNHYSKYMGRVNRNSASSII